MQFFLSFFSFSFYLLIKKKNTFSFLLSNLNQFHRGSIFGHYKFLLALGLSELSPSSSFSRSQTSTQAGDDDARGRLARRRNRGRECSEEAAVNYYGGLRRKCVLNSKDFFSYGWVWIFWCVWSKRYVWVVRKLEAALAASSLPR